MLCAEWFNDPNLTKSNQFNSLQPAFSVVSQIFCSSRRNFFSALTWNSFLGMFRWRRTTVKSESRLARALPSLPIFNSLVNSLWPGYQSSGSKASERDGQWQGLDALANPYSGPLHWHFHVCYWGCGSWKVWASQLVALANQGRLLLDECLFLVALLQNRREVCCPVRRTWATANTPPNPKRACRCPCLSLGMKLRQSKINDLSHDLWIVISCHHLLRRCNHRIPQVQPALWRAVSCSCFFVSICSWETLKTWFQLLELLRQLVVLRRRQFQLFGEFLLLRRSRASKRPRLVLCISLNHFSTWPYIWQNKDTSWHIHYCIDGSFSATTSNWPQFTKTRHGHAATQDLRLWEVLPIVMKVT